MWHWYGTFVGLAIVVALEVAKRVVVGRGGSQVELERVGGFVVGGGILGARLYHIIDYASYYRERAMEVFYLWNGGLAIWGGIVGGILGYLVAKRLRRRSGDEWRELGAMAVALPLSQAIGRVANAVNGEFAEMVWVMPWWGWELGLNLSLFGILIRMEKNRWPGKALVGLYGVGYGMIRLMLEGLRVRSWEIGVLPVASIFSVSSVIIGIWLLLSAHGFFATWRARAKR